MHPALACKKRRPSGGAFFRLFILVSVGVGIAMALPRSAPVQGVSRPPHTASRDCRNGSPLARAIPCAPAPECGDTRQEGKAGKRCSEVQKYPAFLPAHPHAAQRAVTGWRGGLGRVGADLASAGSMRPPPSPARHVSTVRLATTPASRETARYSSTAWLATTHASRATARHHNSQPRNLSTAQHAAKNAKHWPDQSQAAQPDKHWL